MCKIVKFNSTAFVFIYSDDRMAFDCVVFSF